VKTWNKMLNECAKETGEEWTSLDLFYRDVRTTRDTCKLQPDEAVWWDDIVPGIRERM
jgi:hypothetical protein